MERDPKKPQPAPEGGRAAARIGQLEQQRGLRPKVPAEKAAEPKPKPSQQKE